MFLVARDQDVLFRWTSVREWRPGPKADLLISIHADTLDVKRSGVKSLQEVRKNGARILGGSLDEQAGVWRKSEQS